MMPKPENQHTYNKWKAVTEADFVTLFIKTWFAFVSTLRELYSDKAKPYYAAAGDSPFVNAYKDEFSDKFYFLCPLTEGIEQSLHETYKAGLKMVSEKYPRFLFEDFYYVNQTYSDRYEAEYSLPNGYSGRVVLSWKCTSEESMKVTLTCDDSKFLQKTNETHVLFEKKFDYRSIMNSYIEKLEKEGNPVDEAQPLSFFYASLYKQVLDELFDVLDRKQEALPGKGTIQVKYVYATIKTICIHAADALKNSCLDEKVGAAHKLLSQTPITNFLQSYGDMTAEDERAAYLWFVGFVYRLRNALFHEIIDPLDSQWQKLFKNAYLVLKEIVDANIRRMKTVGAIFEVAQNAFEKDFEDAPPPQIPIDRNDGTTFSYDDMQLVYYNETGSKVHIAATITCKGVPYRVECNVKRDEHCGDPKVKNVQIEKIHEPVDNNEEKTA